MIGAPARVSDGSGAASKMDELRLQFVERCSQDAAEFSAFSPAAAMDESFEQVRKLAHRLAGAAAVFGYAALCGAAERLEDRLASADRRSEQDTLAARDGVTAEISRLLNAHAPTV